VATGKNKLLIFGILILAIFGLASFTDNLSNIDTSTNSKLAISNQTTATSDTELTIRNGSLGQTSFLDSILPNQLLDFTGVQNTYNPGETVDLQITAETIKQYDTADATKVVTLFKCADSGCDDPAPVNNPGDDSCSEEEYWPNYDDCISKNTGTVGFSVIQDTSTSWTWDVEFNAPSDAATYILQGYIYSDADGWTRVTDVSEQKFVVEEANQLPVIDNFQVEDDPVEGETVTISVFASDPDGDSLSFDWSRGGSGNTVNYVYDSPGEKTVTVTVSDGEGGSVSDSVSFTVAEEVFVRWLPPSSGDQCVKKEYSDESSIPSDSFESEQSCEDSLDSGDGGTDDGGSGAGFFGNLWNSITGFFGGLF